MNRIYQGEVTNVEIANPDQHAPRIRSASNAIPRSRERETPLAHRMGEGGSKSRVRAFADQVRDVGKEHFDVERTKVRCRIPFNQLSTLSHQLPQPHHQLFQDAVK